MTAFSFMASAFYILVGVICLSVAVISVGVTAITLYKQFKGVRNGGK